MGEILVNLNFFIAKRIYSNDGEKRKASIPAIKVASVGVAIGLAVMIITVCVVLGFKHTIQKKISMLAGDVAVENFQSYQTGLNFPFSISDTLINAIQSVPHVKSIEPYTSVRGILKTDKEFMGMEFRSPANPIKANSIIISQIVAATMNLKVGDKVFAYFIDESLRTRRFTVDSIYETNMSQYDKSLCFINMQTVRKLNQWDSTQVSGIHIMVDNRNYIDAVAAEVHAKIKKTATDNVQYATRTVQEMYPGLFAWLELLDINVWIILGLMVCVAGFTMISGLLIIILERTQMIGLLKALGSRNRNVRHTFLWFAVFIIGKGMLWGNVIGLGITLLQQYTGIVKLDATSYYVDTVPMEINIPLLILLNIATLVISVLVLIVPSHLISHISPSQSMRYE